MTHFKFDSTKAKKLSSKQEKQIDIFILRQDKQLDKLIAKYKKEKATKIVFTFDSILSRLKAEKKLDFILDK